MPNEYYYLLFILLLLLLLKLTLTFYLWSHNNKVIKLRNFYF